MYSPTAITCSPAVRPATLALAACTLLAGCVSYSPQAVQRLSAYDLCEAQLYSRINLTAETQARVTDEIARRRVDCAAQVAQIDADRERETERHMYENSGP